jgi:hypothetical protein
MNYFGKYTVKHCVTLQQVFASLAIFFFFSCNENKTQRTIEPAFYYWKSVLNISQYELQQLNLLHVNTLYIKFFDVGWNEATHAPVPVAKLQTGNFKLPDNFKVIPTIFITNECIANMDTAQIGNLAINIFKLVKEMRTNNNWKPGTDKTGLAEIQIDCDWTTATKEKYFKLLNILEENICFDGGGYTCSLSCTIRLHQIKFMHKAGVPPVKKALLMCYNMGNLKNINTYNSIIEPAELKKYTGNLAAYPLPLDVALPLFEWKVLFRNNVYNGLLKNLPDSLLEPTVANKINNRFTILADTSIAGYDLKKDDVIRSEQSHYKDVMAAASIINEQLKNTTLRVPLYHLDSVILKKYTLYELENIFSSLR